MSHEVLSKAKAELIELLKREGEAAINEAAEALSLSSSTVRQHLTGLEADGFVEKRLDRDGPGRPSQVYYLTDEAQIFFEHREGELLAALVRTLMERGEGDTLEAFFEGFKQDRVRRWAPELRAPPEELPPLLEGLLKEKGYVPECGVDGAGNLVVELFHCPYPNIVDLVDHPCRAERGALEELLGIELERVCSKPQGQRSCRFVAPGFMSPKDHQGEDPDHRGESGSDSGHSP